MAMNTFLRKGYNSCGGQSFFCFGYALAAIADRVDTAGVPRPLTRGCCQGNRFDT